MKKFNSFTRLANFVSMAWVFGLTCCLWDPVHHTPQVEITAQLDSTLVSLDFHLPGTLSSGSGADYKYQEFSLSADSPLRTAQTPAGHVGYSWKSTRYGNAATSATWELPNADIDQTPVFYLRLYTQEPFEHLKMELKDGEGFVAWSYSFALDSIYQARAREQMR